MLPKETAVWSWARGGKLKRLRKTPGEIARSRAKIVQALQTADALAKLPAPSDLQAVGQVVPPRCLHCQACREESGRQVVRECSQRDTIHHADRGQTPCISNMLSDLHALCFSSVVICKGRGSQQNVRCLVVSGYVRSCKAAAACLVAESCCFSTGCASQSPSTTTSTWRRGSRERGCRRLWRGRACQG